MCINYVDTSASVPSWNHGVHKQIFYSFIANFTPRVFQVLTGTEMLAKRFLKHAQSEIYLAYKFNSLLYASTHS